MHIAVYRAINPKLLGDTRVHEMPRIGELLIWHDNTYRVVDVAHPTEDERGEPIGIPRVAVTAEDAPWFDV